MIKINILYLTNSLHLGGDTNCILKLCKGFNSQRNNIFVMSNGGEKLSKFEEIGIKHFYIYKVSTYNVLNFLKNVYKIKRIVKENDIEVIHSHHRLTSLMAKVVKKMCNVKVVHTQHLCIKDKFKLTNLSLSGSEIITVSNSAKDILNKKSNIRMENITTIYNCIESYKPNKEVDERIIELKRKNKFIIAQISRVIDYKGIYDFIEIAKKVVQNNENIVFLFIGDGPDYKNMQDKINKYKLSDKIILLGAKDNVIDYFEYIDIVLLCSYIEGLPLVPIEAFSQKKLVIATDIDGTNEEIDDGKNGFLIKPKDINGFVNKIEYLYENQELLRILGEEAYINYKKNFTEEMYFEAHKKIYESIKQNYD